MFLNPYALLILYFFPLFLTKVPVCILFQVHVVDGSSPQPEYEFDAIRLELELFNPELAEKPYLVAFNKMDLPEASERWESFEQHLLAEDIQPFCMSAISKQGTHEVVCAAYELVRKIREAAKEVEGKFVFCDSSMFFAFS